MKAIIFDMGGVLVDLDIEACKNAFKEDLEFYEIDEILDPGHQKGIIGDMESGKIDGDRKLQSKVHSLRNLVNENKQLYQFKK